MRLVTVVVAIMFSLSALAQQDSADLARSVFKEAYAKESGGTTTQSGGGTTATREGTAAGVPQNTINRGADVGRSSQQGGAGANNAAGQALMAAGSALMSNPKTVPAGIALMAMGMLALAQGSHDSGAAGASGATFDASLYGNQNPMGQNELGKGSSAFQDPKVQSALQKAADAGYKITDKGVTAPDGSFTPAQSFSSPGAMAAAGMDPMAVREAEKVSAALNDEISKAAGRISAVPVAGGGGGGSSDSGGEVTESGSSDVNPFGNPFALGNADKKKLVAGKTIDFQGEPIGVRGNNIFDMVHEAYQKRRTGNQFIETESAGGPGRPAVRMPASVNVKPKTH